MHGSGVDCPAWRGRIPEPRLGGIFRIGTCGYAASCLILVSPDFCSVDIGGGVGVT